MKSLFVGNLSFQTTEGELMALFNQFGQVTRANVVMDRETGRARGFAFVEMPNDDEAAKAIAGLDGKSLGGRNLKVNEARPKTATRTPRVRAAEEAGTDFRTRTTAKQLGSRANLGGDNPARILRQSGVHNDIKEIR